MMICMSCRRRVDPNRSFCTKCGSSVFIDSTESRTQAVELAPHQLSQEPAAPTRRPRRPQGQRLQTRAQPALDVTSFPFGSLIRWTVFAYIVWKGGTFLLTIPAVRTLVDAVQGGETAEIERALDGLRSMVIAALERAFPTVR